MRKKTRFLPWQEIPEEAPETPDSMDPQRREEVIAAMREDMDALQALHPEAESLEALLQDERGEELLHNMDRLSDLTAAYRLTWYEELLAEAQDAAAERAVQTERARYAAASRGAGKEHLRRTTSRGSVSTELTQADIDRYRLFDPGITPEEIRLYESQYRKTRKK